MARDWSDMLKEVERQNAAKLPDFAAIWRLFEEVAPSSPRAGTIRLAQTIGTQLPPIQRAGLALVVATLLHSVEWPTEWEQARGPVVKALDDLAHPDGSEKQ